jgi:hypothetical protein
MHGLKPVMSMLISEPKNGSELRALRLFKRGDIMAISSVSFWKDLAERALWTGVQAGLALGITTVSDVDHIWAVPIATVLAALKAQVARKVGDPNSAATLKD